MIKTQRQKLVQGHTANEETLRETLSREVELLALTSHLHMIRRSALVSVLSLEVGQRNQEPGQEAVRTGPKPQEAGNPQPTPSQPRQAPIPLGLALECFLQISSPLLSCLSLQVPLEPGRGREYLDPLPSGETQTGRKAVICSEWLSQSGLGPALRSRGRRGGQQDTCLLGGK